MTFRILLLPISLPIHEMGVTIMESVKRYWKSSWRRNKNIVDNLHMPATIDVIMPIIGRR